MIKRIIITIAITAGLIVAGLSWLVYDFHGQLETPMPLVEKSVLKIEPGTSLRAVSETLVDLGWIEHPYYLIADGRLQGSAASIKTGEYLVEPGMTPRQLLALLVSGKVIQYPITIPEGWTFRQILAAVRDNPNLLHTLTTTGDDAVMALLGYPGTHPEGRFFPDTYLFPAGTRDVDFLARAYRRMDDVLGEEWQARSMGLPYRDPYEALIMASIIEKETAVPEERGRIAGVFTRRLQKGMKLQTDPTVIYAAGEKFDGDIRRRDLEIDSPYNTYRYAGLPPTPIAAPGRDSIRAALQPDLDDNALYFVAMGDGRHHFSETLEEHNRAVARYQLNR